MKGIITITIFIYIFVISYGCKQDWDPTCKTGKDCCSKRCFKELSWENGFCISGKTEPPKFDKCQPDYFDKCIVNEHCCSRLCNRSPYDQFGTCTPRASVIPAPSGGSVVVNCKNDGFDKCTTSNQCCSGICEKRRNQKTGICKSIAQPPLTPQCLPDWSDQCGTNEDCCSRLCERKKNPKIKYGRCTPTAATPTQSQPQPQPPSTRQCQEDWSTHCTNNEQCCSAFCENHGNHRFGTCKPNTQPIQPPQGNPCAYDGYNQCVYNENCCSEYCDKNLGQYYGVCRPPTASAPGPDSDLAPASYPYSTPSSFPASNPNPHPPIRRCENDWFNKCTSHAQCCSGWCKTEGDWKYGVCNPTTASAPTAGRTPTQAPNQIPDQAPGLGPSNRPCEQDFFNRCTSHNQCCSGFCETEGNWKYGVCKQNYQIPTEPPKANTCAPDGFNQCLHHDICCSGFCEPNPQYSYGICKPRIDNEPQVDYRINQAKPDNKNRENNYNPAKNCGNRKIGCT